MARLPRGTAGFRPSGWLAYLRARTRDAPLAEVGDWYRAVLADGILACAIEAYYRDEG